MSLIRVGQLAGLALLAVAMSAAAWWFGRSPAATPLDLAPTVTRLVSESLTVHVAGAVLAPGLVQLPADSRVADAVAAAGGATADADLAALNLAGALVDEQQVIVPTRNMLTGAAAAAESDGRVRLNVASASEIETLPGVGPVLAERIVAHRDTFGPFGEIEDLLDVSGIGEAKLAGLRDVVVVP